MRRIRDTAFGLALLICLGLSGMPEAQKADPGKDEKSRTGEIKAATVGSCLL